LHSCCFLGQAEVPVLLFQIVVHCTSRNYLHISLRDSVAYCPNHLLYDRIGRISVDNAIQVRSWTNSHHQYNAVGILLCLFRYNKALLRNNRDCYTVTGMWFELWVTLAITRTANKIPCFSILQLKYAVVLENFDFESSDCQHIWFYLMPETAYEFSVAMHLCLPAADRSVLELRFRLCHFSGWPWNSSFDPLKI